MSWLPLESNPDVMNKYLYSLGVPEKWQMVDVYGLDPELLATVPRPVLAVVLLFPCSDKYDEYKAVQEAEIEEKGQSVSENIYYLKQVVTNACGTIALIHSVANNVDKIQLEDGHLKQFLDDTKTLNPEDRGDLLQKAEGIINTHKELALEGQTKAPDANEQVIYHFVTFVHKDGDLYELDGRKSFPINHGHTSDDTLLEDAAKVCQQYIDRDPDALYFTVVALTAA
ncbi:Ubiquitin carboxyl-terminal hydrolase isozyme L3 [Cryptotermes secundus]|uniref:Ubiquitin carboxyl-terminal hydrolase n=2 Tax=Cryptotermes secundus TaxID=105785 RepID=A0A2J7PH84_9NEOP|nr:ubiquitin carboxyl-terminal hydrolase isozyme L3 [Cryptotermes secundus]PNF15688.1 Ubiquitin carboxyl-terminal hydrolase isozyme L3 [Cryptotermes secundus]